MTGNPSADPRVQRHLEELGIAYELIDNGTFCIVVRFRNNDRAQEVYISSEISLLDNLEIRDIWAVGFISDAPLHADIANALLVYNQGVKMGAWQLRRRPDNDGCIAEFRIPIAANAALDAFQTALETVADIADGVEEKLTGEDRF